MRQRAWRFDVERVGLQRGRFSGTRLRPPFAYGVEPPPDRSPCGVSSVSSLVRVPSCRRTNRPDGTSGATVPVGTRRSGFSRTPEREPDGSSGCPRLACRATWRRTRPTCVRSTIAGRFFPRGYRAGGALDVGDFLMCRRERLASAGKTSRGSSRFDEDRCPALPGERSGRRRGRWSGRGGARDFASFEMQDRQHRAVRAGFRNAGIFHEPDSGPLSASPSPTTQATTSSPSGCVERRSGRVDERVPEFAILVDGARRLDTDAAGSPPGVENCRHSALTPSESDEMCG